MFRLIRVPAALTLTATTAVTPASARGLLRTRVRTLAVLIVAMLAGPMLAAASTTGTSATCEQAGVPKGGRLPRRPGDRSQRLGAAATTKRGGGSRRLCQRSLQRHGHRDLYRLPAPGGDAPAATCRIGGRAVRSRTRTQHHGVIDLVQPFRLYRQCQSRRYLAGAGSGLVDAECQHHTKFVMSGYVEVGGSSSLAFYN